MIDAHRGAFEYDWRTRFHLPLSVVGESMTWGEAIRLTQILTADPSSLVFVAAANWTFPVSREWLLLADIFDLQHMSKTAKKPDPYPRPMPKPAEPGKSRSKPGETLTQDEIIAALRKAGHDAPLPMLND